MWMMVQDCLDKLLNYSVLICMFEMGENKPLKKQVKNHL